MYIATNYATANYVTTNYVIANYVATNYAVTNYVTTNLKLYTSVHNTNNINFGIVVSATNYVIAKLCHYQMSLPTISLPIMSLSTV